MRIRLGWCAVFFLNRTTGAAFFTLARTGRGARPGPAARVRGEELILVGGQLAAGEAEAVFRAGAGQAPRPRGVRNASKTSSDAPVSTPRPPSVDGSRAGGSDLRNRISLAR